MSVKMRKPDEEFRILAFVDDVDENVAYESVTKNPANLQYIRNPTEKVIDQALSMMPKAITFLDNPSREQIIFSCSRAPSLFNKYHDQLGSDDLIELAAKCHQPRWFKANAIFSESAPTHAKKIIWDRIAGITHVPVNLETIPTSVQEKFVSDYPSLIFKLKSPKKSVWEKAIHADPEMIEYMKCPPHARYLACTLKPELALTNIDAIKGKIDQFLIHLANSKNKIVLRALLQHDIIEKANQDLVKGITKIMNIDLTDTSDK